MIAFRAWFWPSLVCQEICSDRRPVFGSIGPALADSMRPATGSSPARITSECSLPAAQRVRGQRRAVPLAQFGWHGFVVDRAVAGQADHVVARPLAAGDEHFAASNHAAAVER